MFPVTVPTVNRSRKCCLFKGKIGMIGMSILRRVSKLGTPS